MEKPAQYDIAERAYALWERDGRPHGRDQEYWFHAERELIGMAAAAEDRPIGEVRPAEHVSRIQNQESAPSSPGPAAATPAPATAAEDRPIGEIRQAQSANVERAKNEKQDAPGLSLLAPKQQDDSAELTQQLNELQRLMAKKPVTRSPSTKTRAKKTPGDSQATGNPPEK